MSQETRKWLSENTLIGFVDKRGNAWHYREGDNNTYPGAIPVEDVRTRLFDWTAEERPVYVGGSDVGDRLTEIPDRKAIVHGDTEHVFGIFKESYQRHQYGEWLIDSVANILDDELGVGSAGLLKLGAVAWVSVEVPDTITTPEGVAYRPNIMAVSSFDGSISTTYKAIVTNVVCDNTMASALREASPVFKVKSTRKSMARIKDAREALEIMHTTAGDFAAEVAALCATKVSDHDWERIVDELAPMPEVDPAEPYGTRGATMAETKRDALWHLWKQDERVSPWRGSAFGAWQAFNTYRHHEGVGGSKPERNMLRAVDGRTEKEDRDTMQRVMAVIS